MEVIRSSYDCLYTFPHVLLTFLPTTLIFALETSKHLQLNIIFLNVVGPLEIEIKELKRNLIWKPKIGGLLNVWKKYLYVKRYNQIRDYLEINSAFLFYTSSA